MSTDPRELPSLGSQAPPSLGSLAQAARQKSLKQAKVLLIVIGVLTILANGAFLTFIRGEVDKEVAKLRAQGLQVKPQAFEALVRSNQIFNGGFVALGIVFVVLGLAVKAYPVPITVTSFVLYVGAAVVMAIVNPTLLVKGLIIKIIIVIAMIKAIQAAIAYERDASAAPMTEAIL